MAQKMKKKIAYKQYLYEVSAFEEYRGRNIISFKDWLNIKGIEVDSDNAPPQKPTQK